MYKESSRITDLEMLIMIFKYYHRLHYLYIIFKSTNKNVFCFDFHIFCTRIEDKREKKNDTNIGLFCQCEKHYFFLS